MRSSPLVQLYLVRLRDFYRQPARVFWVYGFPTLLAIALGIRVQEPAAGADPGRSDRRVGLTVDQSGHRESITPRSNATKKAGHPRLDLPRVEIHKASEAKALERLKTGKTPLVIDPQGSEAWTYRFDPTRPEASAVRQGIDDILQEASGRKNPRNDATSTSPSRDHAISTSSSPV